MNEDTNTIIRTFLLAQTTLTTVVSTRIYWPTLPENEALPAISFNTRGGDSSPYIPKIVSPSVQFNCWAEDTATMTGPVAARQVYRALFDVLQGIQMQTVTVGSTNYIIHSAIEEVQGQDLQDIDIPTYYKVLTFFSIMIQADT